MNEQGTGENVVLMEENDDGYEMELWAKNGLGIRFVVDCGKVG